MLFRFKQALNDGKLILEYQPVYASATGNIVGVEALLRWRDVRFGNVSPETFIALAVANDLIESVSLFVLQKAVSEMAAWVKQHALYLSVNILPADLASARFRSKLLALLEHYELPPAAIMLEVVEVECQDLIALRQNVDAFRTLGFRIALDDFGKGCSNFERLLGVPVSDLKIDKCLTDNLFTPRRNLKGIIDCLYQLPVQLIFEGVEQPEQAQFIRKHYPNASMQGWYFSRALPPDAIAELVRQDENNEGQPAIADSPFLNDTMAI